MKLITIASARSIWLFQIFDWNPRGRSLSPIYFSLIERYHFQKYPKLSETDWQKGIKFEVGSFRNETGEELAVNLTIFNDGLVAETRSSTADSDYFLDQTLSYLTAEFAFPEYQTILRKKIYASELYLRLEPSMTRINHKLQAYIANLSALVGKKDKDFSYRVGINLIGDPDNNPNPPTFRLEPALGFPFSENRYYSLAPVQTDAHLKLLEDFEAIFLSEDSARK